MTAPHPARRALITGLTGQDGLYLAEELLAEGTEVVGLVRPGWNRPLPGAVTEVPRVEADLRDPAALRRAVAEVAPDELYHLAAPTFVPDSWDDPTDTVEAIAVGTADLLAAALAQEPAPARLGGELVARSSATAGSRPSTSARRCARAPPTAWPSSPPTASWGPCAATTASSPAPG